jgi:outer membrane protein OmpA-like peptidoglycan-associated protein
MLVCTHSLAFSQGDMPLRQNSTQSTVRAVAQNTSPPDERMDARLGFFLGVNRNPQRVNFYELPRSGQTNLTPFQEGDGFGVHGGFSGELPILPWLSLGARFSAIQQNSQLRARTESFLVGTSDGSIDSATYQRTMDISMANAGLQFLLGIHPFENFTIYLGGRADFAFIKNYRQIETMLEPSYGRFENGLRTRNQRDSILPDIRFFEIANLNLALMAGLGYELPLNASRSLTFAPEVFYARGMATIMRGQDITGRDYLWQTDNLQATLALRWYPSRADRFNAEAYQLQQLRNLEKQIAQERANIQREIKELKASGLLVKIADITGIFADGKELAAPTVRVEEFRGTKQVQLLPYIFFNENSSVVPARYRRFTSSERMQFRPQTLEKMRPLDMYYQILNIIGKRLSENPRAKIVVLGSNADVGAEKDNRTLSRQRAESVSSYFQDVWKIPVQRIEVRDQNSSNSSNSRSTSNITSNSAPATTNTLETAAEHRRVELTSDSPEILAPIAFETVQFAVSPPSLRLGLSINAGPGLKQWELEVSQFEGRETRTLLETSGGNTYPPQIVWNIDADEASIPSVNGSMDVRLSITDIDNRDADSPLISIPTEVVKIADKLRTTSPDKRINTYTLGFFENDPRAENILQTLKPLIKPTSQVFFDSYSSDRRALIFAQRLGVLNARTNATLNATSTAKSRVLELLKNDASLPEGRFYNRTVRVEVQEMAR